MGRTKKCAKCGVTKPVREYFRVGKGSYKVRAKCKSCVKEWVLQNHTKVCAGIRKCQRTTWAPGEHEKAEAARPYVTECAICNTKDPGVKGWQADHSHATGRYRSHLCSSCNHGLGKFKDNPIILIKALDYLFTHHQNLLEETT